MKDAKTLTMLLLVLACVGTGASAFGVLKYLEQTWFPVLVDWQVLTVEKQGEDVIVRGHQRKVRNCEFVPPIRAETEEGQHLTVISKSPSTGQNWFASNSARMFGPWIIVGGNGHQISLYAEHDCHPIWPVFSRLGTVDAR